jgi:lipoic acid synthetase
MENSIKQNSRQKPDWLKIKVPLGTNYKLVNEIVKTHHLNTICTSGKCPNLAECWGNGTATLMILGDICTRACKFCAVKTGRPDAVDENEPENVALSVKKLNLKHLVITSVDRDDLPDGGARIWAATIRKVKELNPQTTIETLIPDFDGREVDLRTVIDAKPEIISHNLETVKRLTPLVRSRAKYERSLQVLKFLADNGVRAKSGIMLGLGETFEEVVEAMKDLRNNGVTILTLGQYLQPTPKHLPVAEYIKPEVFAEYKKVGLELGYDFVESGPLVRSSYHAEKHIEKKA